MYKELLEKLAINFCEGFLEIKFSEKSANPSINLYGAKDPVLEVLKNFMNDYFVQKEKDISIFLGKSDEKEGIYIINVEPFYPKYDNL